MNKIVMKRDPRGYEKRPPWLQKETPAVTKRAPRGYKAKSQTLIKYKVKKFLRVPNYVNYINYVNTRRFLVIRRVKKTENFLRRNRIFSVY